MIVLIKIDRNRKVGYRVIENDVKIGCVYKREDWTVRGSRIEWEAIKNDGTYIGSYPTRKKAIEALGWEKQNG